MCRKKQESVPEKECVYSYDITLTLNQTYTVTSGNAVKNGRFPDIFFRRWNSCIKGPSSISLNSVLFDSKSLNIGSGNYATENFSDTTSQSKQPPFYWQVNSAWDDLPSFSETTTDSVPEFFNSNLFPDSISRSGSTTIQLAGKNMNEIWLRVYGSTDPNSYYYTTYVAQVPINSVSHAISTPTMLTANSQAIISVSYVKSYSKTFGTAPVKFSTMSTYNKTVYVKN